MSVITNKPFPKYLKLVKLIEMVKFKLGNEMWIVNWSTWHERGTKKKSESPTGIEPMHRAGALSTRLRELVESKII